MLGTNVVFVSPPHIQQCPTMPNNVGICWNKCWHRFGQGFSPVIDFVSGKIDKTNFLSFRFSVA